MGILALAVPCGEELLPLPSQSLPAAPQVGREPHSPFPDHDRVLLGNHSCCDFMCPGESISVSSPQPLALMLFLPPLPLLIVKERFHVILKVL